MTFINKYKQQAEGIVESQQAKFTKGSIMRHVIVMSLTSSIGIIALFLVDLLDFYFISLLGVNDLAAAVGYAGTLLFFTTSIGIGFMIAMGALVSKNIGAGKKREAQSFAQYILLIILLSCIPLVGGVFFFASELLSLLGATGETLDLAIGYIRIVILGLPCMLFAMGLSSILRAQGEAKQAMYTTLSASIVNGILDPILIFSFSLGLTGAALATLIARIAMLFVSAFYVYKNGFFTGIRKFSFGDFRLQLGVVMLIAIPAILTNLATPIGNAYVTKSISAFGDSAVAGMSMIGRISPVAFAVIFALSGAIGPIIGQNLGAGKHERIIQVVWDSMKFACIYIGVVSLILFFGRNIIVDAFSLTGEARMLGILFLSYLSWLFIFQAMTFIANAVFNNIGYAKNSTIVNFLKATLFTMPFVYFGAESFGSAGVIAGQSIGAIFIGIIALVWCVRVVRHRAK